MANIEGEAKLAADVGMIKGPKSRARDMLTGIQQLKEMRHHQYQTAINEAVEFLLEEFSK